MKKEFSLSVNARHISQLGRWLVTDYVTALVELVKNSYDADAEGVKIIFDGIKTEDGKIILIDTGSGMTTADVEKKWAVIGTNNKVRNLYSPGGRKYAGKKGIGRFSVERLAEKTTIYSFPRNHTPFKFSLDWNKYEEININALYQMLNILKISPNDYESARFIKCNVDYFITNPNVKKEHKELIMNSLFSSSKNHYSLYLNNSDILEKIEGELMPILKEYSEEEVRIDAVKHTLEDIGSTEEKDIRSLLSNVYTEISVSKDIETGLIIILEGLRDEWKQKDILKVQKELRVLVEPTFLTNDSFKPILQADEYELKSHIIVNNIIDLHYAKVEAKLINNGEVLELSYKDKSKLVPINENFSFNPRLTCGECSLELYYFIRDAQNLSKEGFNITLAREVLDEFSGIKIYRDGFHVKPYGDEGNDWLLLDNQKVKNPHNYLVSNNQVIGIVRITEHSNPLLIDATNREGIIENEAFQDLQKFVLFCTNFISNIRYEDYKKSLETKKIEALDKKRIEEENKRRIEEEEREKLRRERLESQNRKIQSLLESIPDSEDKKNVSQVIDQVVKNANDEVFYQKSQLEKERKQVDDIIKTTKEVYEEELDNKEKELSLYKNLASIGMLTGAFGHETSDIIHRMAINMSYLSKVISRSELAANGDLKASIENISSDISRMQGFGRLIVNFVKKDKREKYDSINFKSTIEEISELYFNIIKSQNINILLELDDFQCHLKMFQIDLESIIINLITNSFEALKATRNKVIKISSKEYEEYYEIIFEDNGHGIKDGYEKIIFSPFHSTKAGGIGLGLAIVKDIVENYNGEISVANSLDHGGAVFTVRFPKGVG